MEAGQGTLTMANLRGLEDVIEEANSTNSISKSNGDGGMLGYQNQNFQDEVVSVTTSSRRSLKQGDEKNKNKDDLYGAEGDLLWKSLVVALLVMIGTAAGFVFLYGLIGGDLESTAKFDAYMLQLEEHSQRQAKEINGGLATWSVHVSSYAILHSDVWPFHQFHHFQGITIQHIGKYNVNVETTSSDDDTEVPPSAKVEFFATAPLVSDAIRTTWEIFSVQQSHQVTATAVNTVAEAVDQGRRLEVQGDTTTTATATATTNDTIPSANMSMDGANLKIHRFDENGNAVVEEGPGPYLPLFQLHLTDPALDANLSTAAALLNLNLLSIPAFARAYSLMQHTQKPVLSEPIIFNKLLYGDMLGGKSDEPYSFLVNPIIGGNHTMSTSTADTALKGANKDNQNMTVVGALVGLVPFKAFFEAGIPSDTNGIAIVARPSPTCEDQHTDFLPYTFQLDGGSVKFLGVADKHDTSYNFHETEIAWDPFLSFHTARSGGGVNTSATNAIMAAYNDAVKNKEQQAQDVYCRYELWVYPSDAFYNTYRSNTPRIFAGFLVAIFLFVIVVFALYNTIMRRKDRMAHVAVQRSNAIVDMFFPKEVKQRLLEQEEGGAPKGVNQGNAFQAGAASQQQQMIPAGDGYDPTRFLEDKPIASLFPAVTVMFSDIAGFTAWSSEREPSQVFILLETIYGEFDKVARRRKVFKVETIGDCYLAVTGIPDPQPDHAVIMCQFARECMAKMYDVTAALELTLGPDTSDLAMRMGLHSGPVTAGVLRGRKSHFQLFGDTVNTASRMESTGMREKIQLSQETADLLMKSGRSNWVKLRDNVVEAKGKGRLPTFWLLPRTSRSGSAGPASGSMSRSSSTSKVDSDASFHDEEDDVDLEEDARPAMVLPGALTQVMPPKASPAKKERPPTKNELSSKSKRLVQWNVALLVKLLKKIAASRNSPRVEDSKKLAMLEKRLVAESSILNEVQETIAVSKTSTHGDAAFGTPDNENADPPAITRANSSLKVNPDSVFIPDDVVSELSDYVSKIALLHPENPFHNFEHASHVTMSTSKLLSRIVNADEAESKSASTFNAGDVKLSSANQRRHAHETSYGITSDPLTQFSIVFAALIHDVDHPGVSNAILLTENPKLAEKYNQKSIAEQKSVDVAFNLLMEPEYENVRHYIYTNEKQLMQFRQLIVNSVIATDIFDREHSQFRKARWAIAFAEDSEPVSDNITSTSSLDRKATIVIEHLIQASDVSHTMQHWHVYQKWNGRLFDEMYLAYKSGRSKSNPALNWYKGELWFFDNYVIPLAKKLETCGVFGVSSDEFLNYANENRKEWSIKGEQIVQEMATNLEDAGDDLGSSKHIRNDN